MPSGYIKIISPCNTGKYNLTTRHVAVVQWSQLNIIPVFEHRQFIAIQRCWNCRITSQGGTIVLYSTLLYSTVLYCNVIPLPPDEGCHDRGAKKILNFRWCLKEGRVSGTSLNHYSYFLHARATVQEWTVY